MQLAELLDSGAVRQHVAAVYPLTEARAALEEVRAVSLGRHKEAAG